MPTKDPHVACIDAHEQIEAVKGGLRDAIRLVQRKTAHGKKLSTDDWHMIQAIRAQAIDQVKRIQDKLAEELEGHGRLQ